MRSFLLFNLLICALVEAFPQPIVVNYGLNGKFDPEKIILQEKDFGKDTVALKVYLQPLVNNSDQQSAVIYHGLLANGFSKALDKINERSNAAYFLSIQKAKDVKNIPLEIWAGLNYAAYLYYYRDMTAALPFFMDAITNINRIGTENIIQPGESLKRIGYYMGTIGDNAEAINYLKKALLHTDPNTPNYASILDNIGLYYFYENDLKNASQYFADAAKMATEIKDFVRYGKALGNMALVHQKNGEYETAINLVREDIAYSEKYKSDQNTMYAYTLLGRLLLENGNVAEAEKALNKAETIAISKSYFQAYEQKILALKLDIFKKSGNLKEELIVRRRFSELEDSLQKTEGDIALKKVNWMAQKARYLQEIDDANAQFEREEFRKRIYFALTVVALLLIVAVLLNARNRLKKRRRDYDLTIRSFENEKMKYEQKLNEAQKNLKTQILYLKEKNQQIKQLNVEIDRIKETPSYSIEMEKGRLQALLNSHLMTEENWISFKREFKKEYPQWYRGLLIDFPELTESNLRVVLLTKLGFNNSEIADLLGITYDAVKKSKQRLKKKLGSRSDDLFEIIEN